MILPSLSLFLTLTLASIAELPTGPPPQWTVASARTAAVTLDAIEEGLCVLATDHPLLSFASTCPQHQGADGLDHHGLSVSYQYLPLGNCRECPGVILSVQAVPPGAVLNGPLLASDYQIRSSLQSRAGPGYHVFIYARDDDAPTLVDDVFVVIQSAIEAVP